MKLLSYALTLIVVTVLMTMSTAVQITCPARATPAGPQLITNTLTKYNQPVPKCMCTKSALKIGAQWRNDINQCVSQLDNTQAIFYGPPFFKCLA